MKNQLSRPCVVGIGEALFDVFESGPRLGGAPLNVAVHCHRLLQQSGGVGRVVSRIADDELGQQLLEQVANQGLTTDSIQRNAQAPTGRVEVQQHADGTHSFHIAARSAWDEIEFTPDAASLARACDAVAFGTLAQRSQTSRQAIHAFLDAATNALKLFDVNFRASDGKAFFDQATVTASCETADLIKLNDEEIQQACELARVKDPQELLDRFNLQAVILTRGAEGTTALTPNGWIDGEPATYEREAEADTVGAGDACTAGILSAMVLGRTMKQALDLGNQMGAFVANQRGATPQLPAHITNSLA